jgi:hypothetical protein
LYTKPKNLPWTNPKLRGPFNDNDIKWIEEEDSRSGIPRMFLNEKSRKFSYKGGKKTTISLYPRNYANKEGSHKNRKVSLQLKLAHVKQTTHDMFNMPMNELCPIWPLEQLLCPQELVELKTIKHRYHVWKNYSERDNEHIV